MPKLQPQERWRRHILERFSAFKLSGQLENLRAKGLTILGRKTLLTSEEWYQSASDWMSSKQYLEWYAECSKVAARLGLAPWTVEMACLLKGYAPQKQVHVMEAEWPRVRVITESTDSAFLARLAYEAQRLGLYVIQRQDSIETIHLVLHPIPINNVEPPPIPEVLPPVHSAIHIRVEVPAGYPPEAASQLMKKAGQLEKELRKCLGYPAPQRLRSSSLVPKAAELRVAEPKLPNRSLYEIVAETYEWGNVSEDERRRKTVKSRRHRLRERLIKPYENKSKDFPR